MRDFQEGDVVIVSTGQAGTYLGGTTENSWVLLANGDIWHGLINMLRKPQDQGDLEACPLDVDRFAHR